MNSRSIHDDADEELESVSSRSAWSSPSRESEYTRSWSSPSMRRTKSKAGSSFHGQIDQTAVEGSCSSAKGKRVPKGHVAVYVDGGKERHVVPVGYLSHPQFRELLERAESEFGFSQKGGLLLPCSLDELQHTVHHIRLHHRQSHPNKAPTILTH
ncbi:hypothetical protein GOP47_0020610 [Adiantum capillus-veneris]|uniref:Uncharacterized protein n=1 Tax=Adiantum capillus-veneris TaxID=13818 RepID=A0A9D4Z7L6_ADICA|nr:hypothetical protein GOP47_0020610 [Adiantum capillus-veneris]